ncbi:MAG: hypothetical protein ABSE70_09090, partial [Candidatus Limnocylindrales bacterium]
MSGARIGAAGGVTPRELADSRQRLVRDAMAISAYALPVGLVYGLAALQAHYSLVDVLANSTIALAGGAQ